MYIVGLGNPGEEYVESRHNVGRIILEKFRKKHDFSDWQEDKKMGGLVSGGKIGANSSKKNARANSSTKNTQVILFLPNMYMNKSGASVKKLVTSKKKAQDLVVVYDEIDMALGNMKIVFNRGSGGHKGVESVARALGTKEFTRVRIGISPSTPTGKLRKPKGDQKVIDFVLGKFNAREQEKFKKIQKKALEALEIIVTKGRASAMNEFN